MLKTTQAMLTGLISMLVFHGASAEAFEPRVGDEATYEVTTPMGTTVHRRVVESYDETKAKYAVAIYQDANGSEKKQVDWIDAAKLEAIFITDLSSFCTDRAGKLTTVEFEKQTYPACYTLKDNGILKQEEYFMAGVPFGTFYSEKKSPLHPKAGTATRLMMFKIAPR